MLKADEGIMLVNPRRLRQYLLSKGWLQRLTREGGRIVQLCSSDAQSSVLIPMDNDFYDYPRATERAIREVADYYGIETSALLLLLESPNSDILKWRIIGDSTVNGTVPMDAMLSSVKSIKDIIISTCMDIVSPSSFHPRQHNKTVESYLSQYSFGQSEFGSYVLSLICPLGEYQIPMFEEDSVDMPFLRRVNIKLMEGIDIVQNSLKVGTNILDEKIDSGILSVNFLDALCGIYKDSIGLGTKLTLRAIWDNNLVLPQVGIPSDISFENECLPLVSAVADQHRPKEEQDIQKTFYGKITEIASEPIVSQRDRVSIVLVSIGDEGNKVSINVDLDYQQYIGIVDKAFHEGRDVKVTGIYSSSARVRYLNDASIELL